MRSSDESNGARRASPAVRSNGSGATTIGLAEWFPVGARERVEDVLADLADLDVTELRTGIAWSDYEDPGGAEWYAWLLPRLARQVRVLPYLLHAPCAGTGLSAELPADWAAEYPEFVRAVLSCHGSLFECVELCCPPVGTVRPGVVVGEALDNLAVMIDRAAASVRESGKRVVLGGLGDANGLEWLFRCGAMNQIDVIGICGFPGVREEAPERWQQKIERFQQVLDDNRSPARVWITETGYPTVHHNVLRQLQVFLGAIESSAERVYWYAARDAEPDSCSGEGPCLDERDLAYGLKTALGRHKLLSRIWTEQGIQGVYAVHRAARRLPQPASRQYTLITGGAGFIGSNLADRLLSAGRQVMIYDSLARSGVERNLEWLHGRHGDRLIVEIADIRNTSVLRRAVQRADQVFDFSAQVAVTTSLLDPLDDFEVNARGTVNLLEAIRATGRVIPLVFTSTNKVYGGLADVRLRICGDRYEPVSRALRIQGVDETRPLDFHSPYGCSKGAADQYVLDYARTMGQAAVVFRMSCIYGPRQFGTEDQGWVAHFLIRAMQGLPITLYGDGRQVRDILFVEDLLDAFELAQANMKSVSGHAFNIGGGPARTISLLELNRLIEELTGQEPVVRFEDWRAADQKYYVSNTLRFQRATGWGPKVSVQDGVRRLYDWLCGDVEATTVAPTECVGR